MASFDHPDVVDTHEREPPNRPGDPHLDRVPRRQYADRRRPVELHLQLAAARADDPLDRHDAVQPDGADLDLRRGDALGRT